MGELIEGRYYAKGNVNKFLYPLSNFECRVYLANTGASIIQKIVPDLSDPNCRIYYAASCHSKAFYDHARFYASKDYESAAWQVIKYCDHSIFLAKECSNNSDFDDNVYAIASHKLVPFIVIGKLLDNCVIGYKFREAVNKFVP